MRILLFLILFVLIHSASAMPVLVLAKGEFRQIPVPPRAQVHNSSGRILGVKDLGSHLQVLGKSFGSSYLKIGPDLRRVVVVSRDQRQFADAVQGYLHGRPGLSWVPEHPCHRLTGELLRFSDWATIRNLASIHSGCFRFEAEVATEVANETRQSLESELRHAGLPRPRIELQPRPAIYLEPAAPAQLPFIRQISESWGLRPEFSSQEVTLRPLIRTQIIVAEVSRQRLTTLGLSWPDSVNARLVPRPEASQDWGLVLNAIEQSGAGRVLANPSLLSRSGDPAEFLAGGEVPLRLTSYRSRQITYKKYGISLQVLPRSDRRGYLDVDLKVEVSHPDLSMSAEGLPAFKVNQIKSHFNLDQRQTIALGGLIRQESGTTSQGLPWLSQLPILGHLFASKDFRESRSELIILVTPEVYEPSALTSPSVETPDHDSP
ncbi:MAG: type II and III secretion system protein [Bdellovibrionales bacterium]|nr:type II and III secretion system protein [Bdellovibrionales bacterium]